MTLTFDQLDFRLVRCCNFQGNAHWNYQDSCYPYNTLYFPRDGDGFVRTESLFVPLEPGHVYLIPAGRRFDCWCESRIDKLYADVYAELLPGMDVFYEQELAVLPFPKQELLELSARAEEKTLRQQLWVKGKMISILADFLPEQPEPDSAKLLFKPLLLHLQQHLTDQLQVQEIAALFGWNPSVLSRSFKRAFGMTLKSYMEQLLLSRIKQELLITTKSLKEIGEQYSFCDAYYLSNFFKRLTGISPEHYRRQNAGST